MSRNSRKLLNKFILPFLVSLGGLLLVKHFFTREPVDVDENSLLDHFEKYMLRSLSKETNSIGYTRTSNINLSNVVIQYKQIIKNTIIGQESRISDENGKTSIPKDILVSNLFNFIFKKNCNIEYT